MDDKCADCATLSNRTARQKINKCRKIGIMTLLGGLEIDNVLYVPQLTCNLISVTQLHDELHCVAYFTNKLCVI